MADASERNLKRLKTEKINSTCAHNKRERLKMHRLCMERSSKERLTNKLNDDIHIAYVHCAVNYHVIKKISIERDILIFALQKTFVASFHFQCTNIACVPRWYVQTCALSFHFLSTHFSSISLDNKNLSIRNFISCTTMIPEWIPTQ